jgi:hypothetical protein
MSHFNQEIGERVFCYHREGSMYPQWSLDRLSWVHKCNGCGCEFTAKRYSGVFTCSPKCRKRVSRGKVNMSHQEKV